MAGVSVPGPVHLPFSTLPAHHLCMSTRVVRSMQDFIRHRMNIEVVCRCGHSAVLEASEVVAKFRAKVVFRAERRVFAGIALLALQMLPVWEKTGEDWAGGEVGLSRRRLRGS